MKCFTLKSGNEYIGDEVRVIKPTYWDGCSIVTTEDIDEAKHYRTKLPLSLWQTKWIKYIPELIKQSKARVLSNTGYGRNEPRIQENNKVVLDWLLKARIEEADLESPSFLTETKIKFRHYWGTDKEDHKSNMVLSCVSHSRFYCKACNVVLKNIPFYTLPQGNNFRICVGCLYLRNDAIKKAFESMPEQFRTNFINELILGSL